MEKKENISLGHSFFELKALKKDPKAVGIVLLKNISMVGRSINCDLCLNKNEVSSIHAVVEIRGGKGLVYDMNSSNGTFVNGNKVVGSLPFQLGDKLSFAGVEFEFKIYAPDVDSKYKLDVLAPEKMDLAFSEQLVSMDPEMRARSELTTDDGESFPFIVEQKEGEIDSLPPKEIPPLPSLPKKPKDPTMVAYPLASDPKADFSEYIFEEINDVKPIFNYEIQHACIEIMILFQDDMISVDYLPEEPGSYFLAGFKPKESEVEFSPLGKNKKAKLVDIDSNGVHVLPIPGYTVLFLQDSETKILDVAENQEEVLEALPLKNTGIVRFHQGEIQIFVRRVDAPPEVKPAPFMAKDEVFLKKYFGPILSAALLIFLISLLIPVQEEEKEEKEIKRLAKILHRKKRNPKPQAKKTVDKVQKAEKKTENNKKKKKKVATSTKKKRKSKAKTAKKGKRQNKKQKQAKKVDTYKPFNFKSSISSLLNKGKAASKTKVKNSATKVDISGAGGFTGKGASANLKRAKVSTKVGSLEGISAGRIDTSTSAKGLAQKGGTVVADIPTRTVVKGSIDPQVILQILREYMPQFQHCYQREIEASAIKNRYEGQGKLDFRIGASGNVVKAKVYGKKMNKSMSKCMARVLRGIRFPQPKGGGIVDVVQPINFNIN